MAPYLEHVALFLSGLAGGGSQRRMLALAGAFVEAGYRVDLVAVRPQGPFRERLPAGVELVGLDPRGSRLPGFATRRGLWVPASAPALVGYLRRARPDVLLSTSTPANLASLWARRLARVPTAVVITVNVHLSSALSAGLVGLGVASGDRPPAWAPVLRAIVRRSYAAADAVIANCAGVTEDLVQEWGVPAERVVTIPNPIAAEEIARLAGESLGHPWLAEDAPPVVLGVGKLQRQKDFPTLVRAFARVRAVRPARLVILGEGRERGALEQLLRDTGVAEDAALPGFADNPFAWMARAGVFVLSSAWEGFSNVLAEALACGCPVVSTDCPGGPAELLDHGVYGALVPVGNDRALADAILAALAHPPPRERQRARAAQFTVKASAQRYLEVLCAAARARRSR